MISLTCGTPLTLLWQFFPKQPLLNILQLLQSNVQYGADPYCYIPNPYRLICRESKLWQKSICSVITRAVRFNRDYAINRLYL